MLNLQARWAAVIAATALLVPLPASGTVLGPAAARCTAGAGPAVLIRVSGLKNRAGTVRARLFPGGNSATWFNKKTHIGRIQVPAPKAGSIEICMPVPRPGAYVVDIRHDVNNNGDTDRADGGGASGNPNISMIDVIFGRKPPASKVVFKVGNNVTPININVKYG